MPKYTKMVQPCRKRGGLELENYQKLIQSMKGALPLYATPSKYLMNYPGAEP